jgi:LPXTG-motif cell wall-anchored protein
MKLSVRTSQTVLTVAALALAMGATAHRANADEWNKRTILTVNETIQVKDTVLEPGQYILKLLNSPAERHIVQIFDGDQSHLIGTVFAIPKQRMQVTGDSQFTFWETPPGTAKALRAWFYPGDSVGQEFPYPEHPQPLAMAESPSPAPSADVTEPAPAPSIPSQPAAEEPVPLPAPDVPAAAPTPVADTPEPSTAAAAGEEPTTPVQAEPEPAQAQPAELPKTGSPYPLLGIAGVWLLALGGLLRLKRSA